MKTTYHPNDWGDCAPRLELEDEYGNKGSVHFPYSRERGFGRINVGAEWIDARIDTWTNVDGGADEVGQASEFLWHLAHVAKTLDLAFAADKEEVVGRQERWQAERERRDKIAARALQMRCEELAQYYMQLVRVQREGHNSHAKGELHVVMLREGQEDQAFQRRMYLKESNGNRWEFQADAVAKFEVKDGNRYDKIKLTPMETLRAQASVELNEEAVA